MNLNIDDKTILLKDGRTLGYAEYGDLEGKAVFHFNGSGGSRLEHPADQSILTDLGIRFIATDRPGHGISDPQPDRKLLDWPHDIAQLADHLNIDRFYVQGWSAGGPHALACAYQGLPLPNRMLMILGRTAPGLVYLFRRMARSMIMGDPEEVGKKLAASFPEQDRQLIKGSEYEQLLVIGIQEGYRQGWQGPAQDDIIINQPWGFTIAQIKIRIDIWQGEVDKNVPLNQGQYQHNLIPNSRLTVLPGQAHLYILSRWGEVLAALIE
jgi:pimeloyl-ACP methyl ester carboxylesterase